MNYGKTNVKNNEVAIAASNIYIGGGSLDNLINYTTDEIRIGTWIDGKPLYRKIFKFNTYQSSMDVDVSNLNIDYMSISEMSIFYKNKDGSEWKRPRYTWGTDVTEFYQAYIIDKSLRIRIGNKLIEILDAGIFHYMIVILEYTKTTN